MTYRVSVTPRSNTYCLIHIASGTILPGRYWTRALAELACQDKNAHPTEDA
jgi:hypothetical protein